MESEKVKKKTNVRVGSSNFVSQLFFLWVFWLIILIRRVRDLTELNFILKKCDMVNFNDRILEKQWADEVSRAAKKKRYEKSVLLTSNSKYFLQN
jgi:hypothetical protein